MFTTLKMTKFLTHIFIPLKESKVGTITLILKIKKG